MPQQKQATLRMDATLEARCVGTAQRLSERFAQSAPPISLRPLLEHFEVMQVRERPLDREACLKLDTDGLIIEVNSLHTALRRRLGIAHEIGHLIVSCCSQDGHSHWGHYDNRIENLCDRLARQLLVPDWAIWQYLGQDQKVNSRRHTGKRSLRQAASIFGIPVATMALRVAHEMNLGHRFEG
jgi:Zn-dependent peptidase ImmA (M78 family)